MVFGVFYSIKKLNNSQSECVFLSVGWRWVKWGEEEGGWARYDLNFYVFIRVLFIPIPIRVEKQQKKVINFLSDWKLLCFTSFIGLSFFSYHLLLHGLLFFAANIRLIYVISILDTVVV